MSLAAMVSPEGAVPLLPSEAAVGKINASTSKVGELEILVTAPAVPDISAGKPDSLSAVMTIKVPIAAGENSAIPVPVIDLSGLRTGDPEARARIAREVGEATEAWGFFQVVNHSVGDELQDKMREQAKQLFALPEDVKKRAQIKGANRRVFGYQAFVTTNCEEKVLLKESMADSRSPGFSLESLTSKIWPDGNVTFSDTLEDYCRSVEALGRQLLEILAESVCVQSDFYSRHFKDPAKRFGTWRLHHFPASVVPLMELRTDPHADPSVITLLAEDVGALQVKRVGLSTWIDVKRQPGSFVVNVGDILEAWSNGRFPSVEHRVILKEKTERLSMVVFLDAWPTLNIDAPAELIDEEHPRLFMPFVARDFRDNFENIKDGGDISRGMALGHVRIM